VRPLSPEELAEQHDVSRETLGRLKIYVDLLARWQTRINLVGPDTMGDVWRRHILDSVQVARLVPPPAETIADLGSGAGLPGLVMAILLEKPVHLIESVGKKASFLQEAARATGAPATVHKRRIEAVQPFMADVVTARALAPLERLLGYAHRFATDNTIFLFPKGTRAEEELTEAQKNWTMQVMRHPSVTFGDGVILEIRDLHSLESGD